MLGEIRLPNGGHVDFWSVDHSQRAGRGRKYHLVLIDEAAHDEGYLTDTFPSAIAPTLIDYAGAIVEASDPQWRGADQPFLAMRSPSRAGLRRASRPDQREPASAAGRGNRALRATMRPGDSIARARRPVRLARGHEHLPPRESARKRRAGPRRRAYRHDWRCDRFGRGRRRLRTRRHGGNPVRHASTARRSGLAASRAVKW